MRLKPFLVLIVCFTAVAASAQLYVGSSSNITIKGNTSLYTQESVNTIDGRVSGDGALVLGNKAQELTTVNNNIILSNVILEDATGLTINAPLAVTHTITARKGELTLTHSLIVNTPDAIILENDAFINETLQGRILYKSEYQVQPLNALPVTISYPTYVFPPENKTTKETLYRQTTSKISTRLQHISYIHYMDIALPPPKTHTLV